MTEPMNWDTRAQALNAELASVEQAAVKALIPPEAIAQMRQGVDHCRNTLWDVLIASSKDESGRDAIILASRLSRIQEMCSRVVDEIVAGRMWSGTPGLALFVAALDETERRVRKLLEESTSSRGR